MAEPGRGEYSIAAVSKLTGIGCHALRVWERRYGFPTPKRSPSGHRRYAASQVALLRLLAERLRRGRPLGELMGDVRAGRLGPVEAAGPAEAVSASGLVDRLLAGDPVGAEAELDRLGEGLGPAGVVERVLHPALVEAGERWFRGDCDAFQEHWATGFLARKLGGLFEAARRANARPRRTALLGTVQGDRHEAGVLMVGLVLELSRWRAICLGADLPVREYQRAVEAWRPDALALSFVLSRNINKRFGELAAVRGAPVFVGGRSILNYQGLARRHGLIPLPGPATSGVRELIAHVERCRADPVSPGRGPPETAEGGAP